MADTAGFALAQTCLQVNPSTSLTPRKGTRRRSAAEPPTASPAGSKVSGAAQGPQGPPAPVWGRAGPSWCPQALCGGAGSSGDLSLARCLPAAGGGAGRRGPRQSPVLREPHHQQGVRGEGKAPPLGPQNRPPPTSCLSFPFCPPHLGPSQLPGPSVLAQDYRFVSWRERRGAGVRQGWAVMVAHQPLPPPSSGSLVTPP